MEEQHPQIKEIPSWRKDHVHSRDYLFVWKPFSLVPFSFGKCIMFSHLVIIKLPWFWLRRGIIKLKVSLKHAFRFFSFLHCFLLLIFVEKDLLFILQVNIQPHNRMRHLVHLEAEQSPSCFISSHISRVNEVFDLVYEDLLFFLLIFNLSSIVSFINVLEEIFYCRERSADLNIDVGVESLEEILVERHHILIWNSFIILLSFSPLVFWILVFGNSGELTVFLWKSSFASSFFLADSFRVHQTWWMDHLFED